MKQRIVLAGGGHAHLSVLEDWLNRPSDAEDRVLVMPSERSAYSGMLPGWMAGIYPERAIFIPVAQLARKAGAQVILASVEGLDANAQQLHLSNGERLDFDLLSLATGGQIASNSFEALGKKLLTVRPVDAFVQNWSQFVECAAAIDSPKIAIVGAGAGGVELAFAARARMQQINPNSQIWLIAPETGFLHGHSAKVRDMARKALLDRGIALHWSMAQPQDTGLVLEDGTFLQPDLVMLATGSRPQGWLAKSGLACNRDGFVQVDGTMQTASHPNIFAAGDIVEQTDRPLERSGVHAVKAGPVLAKNLHAMQSGAALQTYDAKEKTLYLLSTSDSRAIMSWGGVAIFGRSPWWLKERIDRAFVDRFTRLAQ